MHKLYKKLVQSRYIYIYIYIYKIGHFLLQDFMIALHTKIETKHNNIFINNGTC